MFEEQNQVEIPHMTQLMLSDPGQVDKWFQQLKLTDRIDNQRKNKKLREMIPKNVTELEDDRYLVDIEMASSKNIDYQITSLEQLNKQPHEYLKQFNNLVSQMTQDTLKIKKSLITQQQLEIRPLTKFRLPKYFLPRSSKENFTLNQEQMESSHDTTKKKMIIKSTSPDVFLQKHNRILDEKYKNLVVHRKWVKNKNELAKKQIADNKVGNFKMEDEILDSSSPNEQRRMLTVCSPYMLKHINKQSQGYLQYQQIKLMVQKKLQAMQALRTPKNDFTHKQQSQNQIISLFDQLIPAPKLKKPLMKRTIYNTKNSPANKKLSRTTTENEIKEVKEMFFKQPFITNKNNDFSLFNYVNYIQAQFGFPTQIFKVSESTQKLVREYHSNIKSFM